jgi:hypothetical protein
MRNSAPMRTGRLGRSGFCLSGVCVACETQPLANYGCIMNILVPFVVLAIGVVHQFSCHYSSCRNFGRWKWQSRVTHGRLVCCAMCRTCASPNPFHHENYVRLVLLGWEAMLFRGCFLCRNREPCGYIRRRERRETGPDRTE